MTLEEAIQQFLLARRAAGRSERTLEWYRYELEHFSQWLCERGYRGADWFRWQALEAYLAHERERGLSDYTIGGRYRALSAFFKWLKARKFLPAEIELPTDVVEPPAQPKARPRHVTLDEMDRLLASIPRGSWVDQRDRLAVVTLFLTAVRRDELVRLHISDYDYGRQVLVIRRGKGGDAREIPLLPAVMQEFSLYMMVRPAWPGPEVFLAADGSGGVRGVLTGNGLFQRMRTLCKRAGLRHLNPHAFRHGLAMHLLNNKGADMALIQCILGHSQISTTSRIYARWELDGVSAAYVRLMGGDQSKTA